MEGNTRARRSLRNTNPCHPIPNIFKNQNQIPDRLTSVPSQVIDQVKKIPNLACQQITKLSFPSSYSESLNISLQRAKNAVQLQQQFVHKKYPQGILKQTKLEEDSSNNTRKLKFGQPQLIRSQDDDSCGQGIFNNKMFRSEIQSLLLN